MDWKECCNKKIVKEVKEDIELIKSLIKSSDNRLKSESELQMNDVNAPSKVSLAYDSLRELLETLALKNRYKIYNHECYSAFLKEILQEKENGDEFDEIRKIRNAVNYYGKSISTKEAMGVIKRIMNLRESIKIILNIKI